LGVFRQAFFDHVDLLKVNIFEDSLFLVREAFFQALEDAVDALYLLVDGERVVAQDPLPVDSHDAVDNTSVNLGLHLVL